MSSNRDRSQSPQRRTLPLKPLRDEKATGDFVLEVHGDERVNFVVTFVSEDVKSARAEYHVDCIIEDGSSTKSFTGPFTWQHGSDDYFFKGTLKAKGGSKKSRVYLQNWQRHDRLCPHDEQETYTYVQYPGDDQKYHCCIAQALDWIKWQQEKGSTNIKAVVKPYCGTGLYKIANGQDVHTSTGRIN